MPSVVRPPAERGAGAAIEGKRMIEVKDLKKDYGAIRALQNVSFSIERGQVVGLLGPNGAGKSTTMRIITGYISATDGTVTVDGLDTVDDPIACQRRIGYLPEGNPLYRDLRMIESLRFAAEMQGLRGKERETAIVEAVRAAGLQGREMQLIGTLSKGYRQRVGLAQALVHRPPILILDEPTSGLDPNQQEEMRQLLRELGKDRTVIVSTHVLPEVEAVCDRAIIINRGLVVADGTVSEVKARFAGGTQVRVVVRGDLEAARTAYEAFEAIQHVEATAHADGTSLLTLSAEDDASPELMESIARVAFESELGLCELTATRASLEEIFAQLTVGESAPLEVAEVNLDIASEETEASHG